MSDLMSSDFTWERKVKLFIGKVFGKKERSRISIQGFQSRSPDPNLIICHYTKSLSLKQDPDRLMTISLSIFRYDNSYKIFGFFVVGQIKKLYLEYQILLNHKIFWTNWKIHNFIIWLRFSVTFIWVPSIDILTYVYSFRMNLHNH